MSKRRTCFLIGVCVCVATGLMSTAIADVRVANVFADHMVTQRDTKLTVWGWADSSEKVTVQFGGQNVSGTTGEGGKWAVRLAPMKANAAPQEMTVSGKNTIKFADVSWAMSGCAAGNRTWTWAFGDCNRKEDIDSANFPGIRSFRTPGAGVEFL